MMGMSAEEAFSAYEAVRHRLPAPSPALVSSRHAATLDDIADDFDVFLLDAFGVLNIGETAIPGTRERVQMLRAAGKDVLVVSNAASVSTPELLQKYHRLGYAFEARDIVTSRATMAAAMPDFPDMDWGVMAGEGALFEDLAGQRVTILGEDPGPYESVDGFLLIGSVSWTSARQALLEQALGRRMRPVLVANPDIVAPREHGFSAEPGHFAHQLASRTGVSPTFFGKPFVPIFDLAFSRLDKVDKSRIVMVGDSLHTDILGAKAAGVSSALIAEYGFFTDYDIAMAIRRADIVPDFIVQRP